MTSLPAPRTERTQLPTSAARRTLRLGSALAFGLALVACSGGDEADGPPAFGNSLSPFPNSSGNAAGASGTNTGSNPGSQTASNTNNTNPTPAANPSNPNPSPASPSPSPSSTPEGNPNNVPVNTGNSMTGAMAGGAGGAGNGGTGMPPATPPPVMTPPDNTTPPPVTQPAAPDITCPSGAIFCSGFEGTGFPAGTTFEPSYLASAALGTEVTLDTTVFHSGHQSLKMPEGHNYYRMLSVATPASYWVRLYTRSTVGLGAVGSTHATFFMSSIVAPGGDYNADKAVEVAEQFGQVLLNVKDSLFGTGGTNPNGKPGTRLPDNTWSCMEAQFDGGSGDVHIFVEGNEIINAAGWQPPTAFKSFRFGYLRFDSPARDVWMDDVIVAPTRVGCQ